MFKFKLESKHNILKDVDKNCLRHILFYGSISEYSIIDSLKECKQLESVGFYGTDLTYINLKKWRDILKRPEFKYLVIAYNWNIDIDQIHFEIEMKKPSQKEVEKVIYLTEGNLLVAYNKYPIQEAFYQSDVFILHEDCGGIKEFLSSKKKVGDATCVCIIEK